MIKKEVGYRPRKKFTIRYDLDGVEYSASTKTREVAFEINGEHADASSILLPRNWLAVSVTINDKFPILNYIRKKQISQYKYLGIRSATNNAFVSRITINSVTHFLSALKAGKTGKLIAIYEQLGLNTDVQLTLVGGPMLKLEKKEGLYNIPSESNKLFQPHYSFLKKNKSKVSYRADNYEKHINSKSALKEIFGFVSKKKSLIEKRSKSAMQLRYDLDLKTGSGIEEVLSDWSVIQAMLDLELLKISKL